MNPFETKIDRKNISDFYESNWGRRTIGPEQEYPIVDLNTFKALTKPQITRFFEKLEKENNWSSMYDDQTHDLVGVKKQMGSYTAVITTDFGTGTVEINYPYGEDLINLSEQNKTILDEATSVAISLGYGFLGYAIQPVSRPSSHLVAGKGRYKTLHSRFWTTDRIGPTTWDPQRTDVHFHTINAANQVHIGLYNEKEAVQAVNTFNKISPILVAMTANSPIWQGKIDSRYLEPRELFWDWVVNVPQDSNRKGIAREFADLEDYIDEIMNFEPILTARLIGGVLRYAEHFGHLNFNSFLEKGEGQIFLPGSVDRYSFDKGSPQGAISKAEIIKQNGEYLTTIEPRLIDLLAHDSFVWYDARLKAEYGTMELRACGQQPPGEEFVVPALALGIMENLDKAINLVEGVTHKQTKQARVSAVSNGLQGKYAGQSLHELADKLLYIAEEGLMNRRKGEENLLVPIYNRINTGKNPANNAIDIYNQGGMRKLIRERLILHG